MAGTGTIWYFAQLTVNMKAQSYLCICNYFTWDSILTSAVILEIRAAVPHVQTAMITVARLIFHVQHDWVKVALLHRTISVLSITAFLLYPTASHSFGEGGQDQVESEADQHLLPVFSLSDNSCESAVTWVRPHSDSVVLGTLDTEGSTTTDHLGSHSEGKRTPIPRLHYNTNATSKKPYIA